MRERHTLPPLPYGYDALEPYIDERTMRLHHDIHHRGYVEGLNRAEAALARARRERDWEALGHWQRQLAFHGSGHFLHSIFWTNMHPNGGGRPADEDLLRQIERDFGSFEAFQEHFTEAADALSGPGWTMLVWQPMARKLEILQTELHHGTAQWTAIPILVLDLWEHAYYLKYRTRRSDYVDSWWNVVNWPGVAQRLREARRGIVSGAGSGAGAPGPDHPDEPTGRPSPAKGDGASGDDARDREDAEAPDGADGGAGADGHDRDDAPARDRADSRDGANGRDDADTRDRVDDRNGADAPCDSVPESDAPPDRDRPANDAPGSGGARRRGDSARPGDGAGRDDAGRDGAPSRPGRAEPGEGAPRGDDPDPDDAPQPGDSRPPDGPPQPGGPKRRRRVTEPDDSSVADDDASSVETVYGPAAAVRRTVRRGAVKSGTPTQSGSVRSVYGRRGPWR